MGRANALRPDLLRDSRPPLARAELPIDTVSLARYLIGKVLVRRDALEVRFLEQIRGGGFAGVVRGDRDRPQRDLR